jgi:hypothetical protein
MAWLSLLLFLPWFVLLGTLYWLFPRQPRGTARRLFDGAALVLAFVPIWRQVLAVLYAYGAFLAVMVAALLLRGPLLSATATKAASKPLH